jgi:actin related protein 2/3 complex subunit 4
MNQCFCGFHAHGEGDYRSNKELLLTPVVVSRSEKERVFIEGSINSVRVSIAIKQVGDDGYTEPVTTRR